MGPERSARPPSDAEEDEAPPPPPPGKRTVSVKSPDITPQLEAREKLADRKTTPKNIPARIVHKRDSDGADGDGDNDSDSLVGACESGADDAPQLEFQECEDSYRPPFTL